MKTYNISSDSSDDEALILKKKVKYEDTIKGKNDENAYSSLCKLDWQQCEFCEGFFSNRYTLYRHHVNHLTIPIKRTPHQCNECYHFFSAAEDLASHIFKHHRKPPTPMTDEKQVILQSILQKELKIQCSNDLNEVLVKQYKALNDDNVNKTINNEFKKKNTLVQNENNAKQSINNSEYHKSEESKQNALNKLVNNTQITINNFKSEVDIIKDEPLSPTPVLKERISSPIDDEKESIRHRLIFEEDIEDTLFRDISAECHVNIETLCQQVSLDFDDAIVIDDDDGALNLNMNNEEINNCDNGTNNLEKRINNSNGINNFSNGISDFETNSFGNTLNDFGIDIYEDVNSFQHAFNHFTSSRKKVENVSKRLHRANDTVVKIKKCQNGTKNLQNVTNNFQNGTNNFQNGTNNLHYVNNNFQNGTNNLRNKTNTFKQEINDIECRNLKEPPEECSSLLKILKSCAVEERTVELIQYSKAIHYDELMVTDVCACRLCGKEFPNRFQLILHEPEHIKMKKKYWVTPLCCICDKYIAGNYRNLHMHRLKKHPERADIAIQYTTHNCPKCHLKYYNYSKHLKNYHEHYKCQTCQRGFETSILRDQHECGKIALDIPRVDEAKSTILQLCDLCFTFMKVYMQNRHNYEDVGTKSELGVQQLCHRCGNKYFTVKLVKRKALLKLADPDYGKRTQFVQKFKPLTNKERLLKIQNRLKMMKKLNKC